MITQTQAADLIGTTAYDRDGDKIGKVGLVFLDDRTGAPEFVTVNTGFFGTSESYVPIENASLSSDGLSVPFDKDTVKDAPKVDVDGGHLDHSQERELYSYYGLTYSAADTGSGTEGHIQDTAYDATSAPVATDLAAGADLATGQDTSGPNTDQAMTRSEEHLEAGTVTRQAGTARLRKYVTTEQESLTVPVRKERAVLTTEPITEANLPAAVDGPAISEEEHEVTLHEERAVAEAVAVPVERVALGTETVVQNETVTGEVRKEHIEVEGDLDGPADGTVDAR